MGSKLKDYVLGLVCKQYLGKESEALNPKLHILNQSLSKLQAPRTTELGPAARRLVAPRPWKAAHSGLWACSSFGV